MVTKKEALLLSRWNGSSKIRANGKYVLSSISKADCVLGEKIKDENSPSRSQYAVINVLHPNGVETDGKLVLTRHDDIDKISCCFFVYENTTDSRMIDVTSIEMSNAEGVF